MAAWDAFNTDAFSMQSLTVAINDMPFVPGFLGSLGIFTERGIRTTRASIERMNNSLNLVPVTQRGAPPTPNVKDLRDIRDVPAVRLAMQDAIYPDSVQNVRGFGDESAMASLQAEVAQRTAAMARKLDATLEWHRIGAIKGIVLDSDASTEVLNLNTLFGVSAHAVVDFDLQNATPASGAVRLKCSEVIRLIEDNLGAVMYDGIIGLCGSTFFDDLTAHPEVVDTYRYSEGQRNRDRVARREIFYGGILFTEYRGAVTGTGGAGSVSFIAAGEARFFPTGAVDNFTTIYAPADYWETVNTLGLPRYARQSPDPSGTDRLRMLEVQTNVIHLCNRPLTLVEGSNT